MEGNQRVLKKEVVNFMKPITGENFQIQHAINTFDKTKSKNKIPKLFSVNEIERIHHTDPEEFNVTIKVDQAGYDLLSDLEDEVEAFAEKEKLEGQLKVVNERINEINKSARILFNIKEKDNENY